MENNFTPESTSPISQEHSVLIQLEAEKVAIQKLQMLIQGLEVSSKIKDTELTAFFSTHIKNFIK